MPTQLLVGPKAPSGKNTIVRRSGPPPPSPGPPEPGPPGVRDEAVPREALRAAGAATWEAALDYLYDHAFVRAMGSPAGYAELRRTYFGDAGGPGAAPAIPTSWPELLDEFRGRVA